MRSRRSERQPARPPFDSDALQRDGWVALPLLEPDDAARLAERCVTLLGKDGDVEQGDKRTGGTHRAGHLLDRVPEVAGLLDDPRLQEAVAHLVHETVVLSDVAFRCPQPGFGGQLLHGDDVPIASASAQRSVTSIVALCDFTTGNGATAVVPGSHRRPDLQRRAASLDLGHAEIVLTGRAGTAFVFSSHLLHRGTLNQSDGPRPALQALWRPSRLTPAGEIAQP